MSCGLFCLGFFNIVVGFFSACRIHAGSNFVISVDPEIICFREYFQISLSTKSVVG